MIILYPRERGPMGGAPYILGRWADIHDQLRYICIAFIYTQKSAQVSYPHQHHMHNN